MNSGVRRRATKERTLDLDREAFAYNLWQAIKCRGLTYREAARRAQPHLPQGVRLSDVSVWSYAKGRSVPRRLDCVAALARALDMPLAALTGIDARESGAAESGTGERGVRIEERGGGRVRLSVDLETSWQTALAVLRLLEGEGARPG